MENNDKQIIDQALSFVNENNRFAMKTITKNSVSRSNFYKLSVSLTPEIRDDIEESDSPIVPVDVPDDPFRVPTLDELLKKTDKDEPKDEPKDERKDEPEYKPEKERKKTWYERIEEKLRNRDMVEFVKKFYGVDVTGLSHDEILDKLGIRLTGPDIPDSKILNTDLGRK
jgi:hypothetical protein